MSVARIFRALGVAWVVLHFLVACESGSGPQPADRSILTDHPCAAPCWQGIVPGETTLDEAFDILTDLGYRPQRIGTQGDQIGWYGPADYPESILAQKLTGELFAFPGEGLVAFLNVTLEFNLTLGEVASKYGPPEKYHIYKSEGTLVEGGHIPVAIAVFYYPRQGLAFTSVVPVPELNTETVLIDSNTSLTRVYYFAPTFVEQLFYDVPQLKWKVEQNLTMQDWPGLPIAFPW